MRGGYPKGLPPQAAPRTETRKAAGFERSGGLFLLRRGAKTIRFQIHLAMVSRSMFWTMALNASFNSEPVAAS